ncbi:MAG: MFS transporter [Candidatus Woesearchaeota archaeon]
MNHHEHFWWRFFPKKEMTEIYISVAIRTFALKLLALFVPLYLYVELEYSLQVALGFYIVYAVIFAMATPFAAKVAARIGLKHSILLSVPFYLIFYLLLYTLERYSLPVFLPAVFFGLGSAFFWISFHMEFARSSDSKHRGEQVGKREAIVLFTGLLGPLLGGLLIDYFSFGVAFIAASVLLFFSALFLFLSEEVHVPFHLSFREMFKWDYLRNGVVFMCRGIWETAAWVLWPMFVFFILNDYTSLGILGSVTGAVSSLMFLFVGKTADKFSRRKLMAGGLSFDAITWFFRHLMFNTAQIFGVTILSVLSYAFVEVPMGAMDYDKAQKKKEQMVEFFIWREWFICLGRILVLLVVLLTGKFMYGFILVGISNLGYLLF